MYVAHMHRRHGPPPRIQRFVEPAVLLALREGPTHGYELADRIAGTVGVDLDLGNLYRLLRRLEAQGLVVSRWDDAGPGKPKRVYRLTDAGTELLGRWVAALRETRDRIAAFLRRYDEQETT